MQRERWPAGSLPEQPHHLPALQRHRPHPRHRVLGAADPAHGPGRGDEGQHRRRARASAGGSDVLPAEREAHRDHEDRTQAARHRAAGAQQAPRDAELQAGAPAPRRPASGEPAGQLHDDRRADRRAATDKPKREGGRDGRRDGGRGGRGDRGDRGGERGERGQGGQGGRRDGKPQEARGERGDRPERGDRKPRTEGGDKPDQQQRPERAERAERGERQERPDRQERGERGGDRGGRRRRRPAGAGRNPQGPEPGGVDGAEGRPPWHGHRGAGLARRRLQPEPDGRPGLRPRRLPGAGAGDGVRRHRRRAAIGARAWHASGRSGRWRARRAARAGVVRAGHTVLVAVRPEGLHVGAAGRPDEQARVVPVVHDAGAESGAGDDPHPLQQPGALPADREDGRQGDGAAPHGLRHRAGRRGVDRRGLHAAVAGRRRDGQHRLADPPLRAADDGRGAGVGHRAGVRVQPGAAAHEGHDHGLLEPVGDHRQPVGAAVQRQREEPGGDGGHPRHRLQRDSLPDVLLRRLRARRCGAVRAGGATLPDAGQLPQLTLLGGAGE
ncbi:unnamed protein product [Rotaria sp. Silwood1]|nr:unnamed protein product [Rotaria sp. Silwood1]